MAVMDKILKKLEDNDLRNKFIEQIYHLGSKEILWPLAFYKFYNEEFLVSIQKKLIPVFLIKIEDRLYFIEKKITNFIQHQIGKYEHPYLTFYNLTKFYEEIQSEPMDKSLEKATEEVLSELKNKKRKKLKKEQKPKKNQNWEENLENQKIVQFDTIFALSEEKKPEILKRIENLRKKLQVPKHWRKMSSHEQLPELLEHFEAISLENYNIQKQIVSLEIELEHYRKPDFIHPGYQKELDELKNRILQLQKDYIEEKSRAEILEKEVKRLTDLIIENPTVSQQQDELETLKKEYRLLSEKYDLLVNKNIELRNIIENQNYVKSLEDILDKVRDRINKVLKTGGLTEEVMILKIKKEIEQLQRARTYLGKSLYDLGLLLLRLGRKQEALIELRAAKELGVEDPEVNRILNQ